MSIGNGPAGTVFTREYLAALELEEGETPVEAELAGPWTVHPLGDLWAVSAEGQAEEVVTASPEVALLAAALLPGSGREPFYRLLEKPGAQGFALAGADGVPLAYQRHFHPELARSMHVVECLRRDPLSFARVLQASRGAALARAGRILWLWSQAPPASS